MERIKYLNKVLIIFGVATLLTALVDLSTVIFPMHLSVSQWVFSVGQSIAERSLIPILGIISILAGCYLTNQDNNKLLLNIEKVLSVFSILFGICLIFITIFYALTINNISSKSISTLKQQYESVKAKAQSAYIQMNTLNKVVIKKQELDNYVKKLGDNLTYQIESTNQLLLKQNIKTLFNLVLFIFVYFMTGILGFKSSNTTLIKLRFNKTS